VRAAQEAWASLPGDDDRFTKSVERFWKRKELHDQQARTPDELRAVERETSGRRGEERAAFAAPALRPVAGADRDLPRRRALARGADRQEAGLAEIQVRRPVAPDARLHERHPGLIEERAEGRADVPMRSVGERLEEIVRSPREGDFCRERSAAMRR